MVRSFNRTFLTQVSNMHVTNEYLELRRAVLFDQLRWLKTEPHTKSDLLDEFDADAELYAIYADDSLAAIGRLIIRNNVSELPSGACFPGTIDSRGITCEISKCIVKTEFRNRGLFRALIQHCQIRSCELDLAHIFISIIDTPKGRAFLANEHFHLVGTPFPFQDGLIAPPENAILLTRSIGDCYKNLIDLRSQRDRTIEALQHPKGVQY